MQTMTPKGRTVKAKWQPGADPATKSSQMNSFPWGTRTEQEKRPRLPEGVSVTCKWLLLFVVVLVLVNLFRYFVLLLVDLILLLLG